jgi:hypothetical protein
MTQHKKHHEQPKRERHWLVHPLLWIPVVLMLVAMGLYLATMDEALRPGEPAQPPVPAAP